VFISIFDLTLEAEGISDNGRLETCRIGRISPALDLHD
jgi:hypothetical protein